MRLQLIALLLATFPALAADFYVSLSGDDQNSGSQASPFASIAKARDAARELATKEDVTVHLADGVYYLPETLVFSPADSGTAEHPITYRATNEGKVVLSGGSQLDLAWETYRDGIYRAKTPAGLSVDQLFINGERRHMARYPNFDPNKTTSAYQGFAADAFSKERAANWKNPEGGYIHAMHVARWGGYHYRITGKKDDGTITYEGGWQNNRQMGMHRDFRMVENIFEELDAPGEWFHDEDEQFLYYYPQEGESVSQLKVEVVRLAQLIEFKGSEESPVKHLTLQGFTFRHAARTFMETKEPLLRSDWTIYRGGAVFLTGTEDVSILDSEFDQVGGNAIFFSNYNRRGLVRGCHLHDLGASGVCFVGDPDAVRDPLFEYAEVNDLSKIDRTPGPKTNNYPSDCTVADCLIAGVGRVERQPAGIQISMAARITLTDLSIYDCARSGINVSEGTWGGHLIDRCDVFDTVLETHDHGSFNSWGRDRYWRRDHAKTSQVAVDTEPNLPLLDAVETTIIRNSRWRCDHGWDIDLDDGSSNYKIYNNLMLAGGLKFREGYHREAFNNILINNGFHPHVWFANSDSRFHGNIATDAPRPVRLGGETWKQDIDRNFYTSEESLARSKSMGCDQNSVSGDPKYLNPSEGDFRVADDSEAIKFGFKNFPMDQFGVKKPSLKKIAQTPTMPTPRSSHSSNPPAPATPLRKYWLGAKLHSISGEDYSAFGTAKEDGGIELREVPANSPAAKAGLQKRDLIMSVSGTKVINEDGLFAALVASQINGDTSIKVIVIRDQKPVELSIKRNLNLAAEYTGQVSKLERKPVASNFQVSSSHPTQNAPLKSLTDGNITTGYGPMFPNGQGNACYRMDLGSVQSVKAINTWSNAATAPRANQHFTVYGSNASTDPKFDLSKFTPIGTVDTRSLGNQALQATSLSKADGQPLGSFRWILWQVSPINPAGENTSFQELSVELIK